MKGWHAFLLSIHSCCALDISIEYKQNHEWLPYANVSVDDDQLRFGKSINSGRIVASIPDKTGLASSLRQSGLENLELRVNQVDLSCISLLNVQNFRDFNKLISNLEFVAEMDAARNLLGVAVSVPNAYEIKYMEATKKLGNVKVIAPSTPMEPFMPPAPIVLAKAENRFEPNKPNWMWMILGTFIMFQLLSAFQRTFQIGQPSSQS